MKQRILKSCVGLALLLCASNAAFATKAHTTASFSDSLFVKPYTVSKKNVVKLFPNPSTDGYVTVSSETEEEVHLYIFDLEATMLYRVTLTNKEKRAVPKLKKGTYTYDVFKNDESIEQGQIIVK